MGELVVGTFRPRNKRYELKTLPSAWVELRRNSYGAKLDRMQMSSSIKTSISTKGRGDDEDIPAELVSALKNITYLAFAECIVDHNIGDEKGEPLDFRNKSAVDRLEPSVGDEISALIDAHNEEIPEDEAGK